MEVVRALYRLYIDDESSLGSDIDWLKSASLEVMNRNKLIAIYKSVMEKYGLLPTIGKRNFRMLKLVCNYERLLREKREHHNTVLFNQMKKENITFAVRKGESLSCYYKDPTHRISGDTDILIDEKDKQKTVGILESLGYKMGEFDHYNGKIKNYRREELIKYQMSPDHLPHYLLIDDDYPISVDVACSITWHKDDFSYSPEKLIDPAREELNADAKVLDTALHLYRETFLKSSLLGRPPYLLGLFDTVLITKNQLCEIEDLRVTEVKSFSYDVLVNDEPYESLNKKYAYYYSASERKKMENSVIYYMLSNQNIQVKI